MQNIGRIALIIVSFILLLIIGFLFGFTDLEIPGIVCMLLCLLCIAVIDSCFRQMTDVQHVLER